jgi:hypothetical protein
MANKTYARIQGGIVVELVELDASLDVAVVFNPSLTFIDVTGVSPAPQPYWSYTAPSTFAAAAEPVLRPADMYNAAIAAGCQIVSTANPSTLDGTYPLDPLSVGKITAIAAGINAGKGLPGGGSTFNLLDVAGNAHPIGSGDFLNLAAALETYVYDCSVAEMTLLGGHVATWPTMPVTIS